MNFLKTYFQSLLFSILVVFLIAIVSIITITAGIFLAKYISDSSDEQVISCYIIGIMIVIVMPLILTVVTKLNGGNK